MGMVWEMKVMKRQIPPTATAKRTVGLWTPWGVLVQDERDNAVPDKRAGEDRQGLSCEWPSRRTSWQPRRAPSRRRELEPLA